MWPRAFGTASTAYDAELSGSDEIDLTLAWLVACAHYSSALLRDGQLQHYERYQMAQIMARTYRRGGRTGLPDGLRRSGAIPLILLEAEPKGGSLEPDLHSDIADAGLGALAMAAESAITDSMTEMVAVSDVTGTVTMMNRAMAMAIGGAGASGSTMAANTMREHRRLDGMQYKASDLPLNRALRGEVVIDEEMTVTWPGGRRQPVVANATTVRDCDGRSAPTKSDQACHLGDGHTAPG